MSVQRARALVAVHDVANDPDPHVRAFHRATRRGSPSGPRQLRGSRLGDQQGTAGAFSVLQTQGEPPGFGPPLHVHRDAAEAFYVLEGTYQMHLEDRRAICGPGSFVYVPSNVAHTFIVVSDEPGKKLNLFSPAAMVGFFEELADAEANGTPTPELLSEISERNHMGIVGPVPDAYL
jgi:quercetin dioxygenase-like cupin family protein